MKKLHCFLFLALFSINVKSASLNNVQFSTILSLEASSPDISLKYGDNDHQFIEGWQANGSPNGSIIFIHGGCWMSEYDLSHVRPAMSTLAKSGYDVWSVEYRRTGETGGGWPITFDDIKRAVELLVKGKKVVPAKTIIAGHSAGGHLALLYAKQNPNFLKGVVGLAPITDIALYSKGENGCQKAALAFMGGTLEKIPKAYETANPTNYDSVTNQWLLFGKEDTIVDEKQHLPKPDPSVEIEAISGAGHFDFIHPHSHAWTIVEDTFERAFTFD